MNVFDPKQTQFVRRAATTRLLEDRAAGRRLVRTHAHSIVQRATRRMESVVVLSNDERRAAWAARYYALGAHRGTA